MLTNEQARSALKAAEHGVRNAVNGIKPHDVVDLCQTAMCTVIEKFDATRNDNLDGFAYRVAYNLALDWLRGASGTMAVTHRSNEHSAVTVDDEGTEHAADFADDAPSAAERMVRAEFTAELQAAIAELSDSERDAIEAFMAGESLTGTQRVAKHRAVASLRKILG